jgi:shikimate dehydrogenase
LIGLLGWPVAHSFSPRMHNAAARALGLDLVYIPLPVHPEAVETAVRGLGALGFLGANVTIPHKETAIAYLDEIDPAARALGAVNTIQVSVSEIGGATDDPPSRTLLRGSNTDWQGFLADLEEREVPVAARTCLILGAGGSARAVAYALAQEGGRVQISARRPAQAQALVAALAPHVPQESLSIRPWAARVAVEDDALIVNSTPVGMHPYEGQSPWPEEAALPRNGFVYDLVYNPAETRLVQQAKAAGCPTANGLGMLLHQGALAFELWTGIRPDLDVMRAQVVGQEK